MWSNSHSLHYYCVPSAPSKSFSDSYYHICDRKQCLPPPTLLFLCWEGDRRHLLALLFTLQIRPKLLAFPAVSQKQVIREHSAARRAATNLNAPQCGSETNAKQPKEQGTAVLQTKHRCLYACVSPLHTNREWLTTTNRPEFSSLTGRQLQDSTLRFPRWSVRARRHQKMTLKFKHLT